MDGMIILLEHVVQLIAQIGIALAELAGIAVLVITAVRAFINYFRKDEHIRLHLAQGIALALEFKLGGEVLRTVVVRQWTELAILGAVIVLRAVLTLLLHWEIRIEEERERKQIHDHLMVDARSDKAK